MTKLLPLIVTLLFLSFYSTTNNKKNKPVSAGKPVAVTTDKKAGGAAGIKNKNSARDIEALQQSNWYTTVKDHITQSEYFFKKIDSGNCYGTPNRKNNLRFYYTENGFSTSPRKVTAQEERTSSGIQLPQWEASFNIDKKQVGEGRWEVSENKAAFITDNVTVEYINNEEGMRQNFIVQSPLENKEDLRLRFSIKTTLKTVLQKKQLQFFHPEAGNVLNYSDLKVWDANGNILAACFEKDKNNYCIHVDTRDAAYPITIDPLSSTPSSLMESNQAGAGMGCAVSSAGDVNGDGYSDVLVGAYLYDDGQTDEGRVFIYHGSSAGISTTAATAFGSGQANSKFGYSVATAGDVNGDGYSDIVVGAYFFDNGQTDEGAAFVYRGSASGLSSASTFLECNQANAQFGISVASAGDVNGDGYSDVIVGANGYDNGQTNEGAAFIFHGIATGMSTFAATIIESNKANSFFGVSVASAGDVNGDGFSDIIAGAAAYTNGVGQSGEGAAFIYNGSSTGINITTPVTLESNQANAGMGQSVSSAGDVNGDGYSDIIIGAFNYDKGQTDEGAAFIYNGSATGISIIAADTLETNQASAKGGRAVACAGDINGDGYSDVLMGAFLYDKGETDEGAVFVYRGSSTGINPANADTLQSNQADAQMGIAVASAGDVNGDGYSDIIAGAWNYDNGETDEGAAFVYTGSADVIKPLAAAILQSNQVSAQFGFSLAAAGDVNGDGYSDILVGANLYDNGEADEGAAFVFHGSATGISLAPTIILESDQVNAQMGSSVASAGDVNGDGYEDVVVGAPLYNNGQADEGVAFVYYGTATGISVTGKTLLEKNINFAWMGWSVACAGDVNGDGFDDVIIGAVTSDNDQLSEGRAYVYHGSASGIATTPASTVESNQSNSNYGCSVASAGDVNGDGYSDVIVGAWYFTNDQSHEGVAFVYHGSATGISATAAIMLESNQSNAEFGYSVASAGDVNGDGYSDIVVGAAIYDNGQNNEGALFIYHGSSTGISNNYAARAEGGVANASLGYTVSSAGDVNGDGYSDIISAGFLTAYLYEGSPVGLDTAAAVTFKTSVGSIIASAGSGAGDINGDGYSDVITGNYNYSNGQAAEGGIGVYYGNAGMGKRNQLRLYNTDLVTPLQQSNITNPLFGTGLYTSSPLGKQKGKLVWETKGDGQPFSGSPITNSTANTSQQASFSGLGINGIELKEQVSKAFPTKSTYIRARVKYNPATAITGQLYGRWCYPEYFLRGTRNFNLSLTSYVWTGVVSTAWENPLNWSSFTVPGVTSDVLIPGLRPRYPIVSLNTSIKVLTASQGASVTVAPGVNLNVVGH